MKRRIESSTDDDAPRSGAKLRRSDEFMAAPVSKFDEPFPFFRQPKEIGNFSQDFRRKFQHDKSSLKFYIAPNKSNNLHFDLKSGYDCFIMRDESVKENIDDLLRWVLVNKSKFSVQNTENDNSTIQR